MRKFTGTIALMAAAMIAATSYQPATAATFRMAAPVVQNGDGLLHDISRRTRRRNRAILGGIGLGVLGAAIIGSERRRRNREVEYYEEPRRYRRSNRWERHVRRCYRAYRSYDEASDTYVSYSGHVRRCRK